MCGFLGVKQAQQVHLAARLNTGSPPPRTMKTNATEPATAIERMGAGAIEGIQGLRNDAEVAAAIVERVEVFMVDDQPVRRAGQKTMQLEVSLFAVHRSVEMRVNAISAFVRRDRPLNATDGRKVGCVHQALDRFAGFLTEPNDGRIAVKRDLVFESICIVLLPSCRVISAFDDQTGGKCGSGDLRQRTHPACS
jgi:hypothetical protein